MNMNFIHTIVPRNYEELTNALVQKNLSEENQATLLEIIREHKALTKAASKKRKQQIDCATGLLAAALESQKLFPEPKLQPQKDSLANSNTAENIGNDGNTDGGSENSDDDKPEPISPKREKKIKSSNIIKHSLSPLEITCPCCKKTMHRAHKKIVTIIRVQALTEERHELETARCLSCDTKTVAKGPQEKTILNYSLKAAALFGSMRYFYGIPSFRLEDVTASMGFRVPDSSQWDLFEAIGSQLLPFSKFLQKEAANAELVLMDDTTANINEITIDIAMAKMEGREPERTGVHTTGFIAQFALGRICLFKSGLHHAGEFFEKVMQAKTTEETVILMTDAATSNTCKLKNLDVNVLQANCNSHAVRRFDEFSEHPLFEEEACEILKLYGAIFKRNKKLSTCTPEERFNAHKQESLPEMEKIKAKIEKDFLEKRVEPNSPFGGAYKYFINHFSKLCQFCNEVGVPICNNESERLLKRAIRHRKNSMFYKTSTGAAVGDIHMSILMTAKENKIEPVHYLEQLLTHTEKVNKNPAAWLPWNFKKTIEEINQAVSTCL